ncbi:DUF6677 family protein [Botrimarina hoheduenensis]|uniref:DUF6677 domain-containing protein n=1 Tax=Botrimarina hoheduenensis TaxID=2528000 RepID=A0A5C5WC56_9BACT|nr:DUF6677 family protein [Botrimarina hoheduenensis]TWT48244.1 hypothetical protein Pla111_00040 [Botrimarina hoheduenensis]
MNPDPLSPLQLKNPGRAALLAWLFPGLGHLYQGRIAKGVLFGVAIVALFVFGFVVGGGRVAYAATGPVLPSPVRFVMERWPFPCQAGIGAVAIPALMERARYNAGEGPLLGGAFYPPRTGERAARGPKIESRDTAGNTVTHPDELAQWHYEYGYYFELGTIYTVVAGLLNLLVVYDAYSGPLVQLTPPRDQSDNGPDNDPPHDSASNKLA